jgi:MFS family permease
LSFVRPEAALSGQAEYESKIRKNYRWNFFFNVMDGSTFWFGYSFLAPAVILPLYVSHLTGSTLLIGLVAMINSAFWLVPQLFTANWVEHVPVKVKIMIKQGFYLERLPLLVLPFVTWLLIGEPLAALVTFFLIFSWHSFGAGLTAVAWQDMVGKVIPVERRGFFFGLTSFLGNATGVAGAAVAAWLLTRYDFPYGFIVCFAIAGIFVLISYFFIAQTREPPMLPDHEPLSFRQYWIRLPVVLKKDHNFANYLITVVVFSMSGMASGFLAVYALRTWSLPDGKVGAFGAALLIGQSVFNLIFGPLADRKGYKLVLEISALLAALSVLLALVAPQPDWFYMVFALRGATLAGGFLSMAFVMEFCLPGIRPTYIGLSNTLNGIASAVAPIVGGLIASMMGYSALFIVALVLALTAFVMLRWWVHDPRHVQIPVLDEVEIAS